MGFAVMTPIRPITRAAARIAPIHQELRKRLHPARSGGALLGCASSCNGVVGANSNLLPVREPYAGVKPYGVRRTTQGSQLGHERSSCRSGAKSDRT